jgi:hypothetical protein
MSARPQKASTAVTARKAGTAASRAGPARMRAADAVQAR